MFKRQFTMVYNTIIRIPSWIIIVSFLIPIYFMYSRGIGFSFSENLWENLYCDGYLLRLWVPTALLVLLSGFGVSKEDDAVRFLRMKNRKTVARTNLFSALFVTILFIILITIIYALYFRISQGFSLANNWSGQLVKYGELSEIGGNTFPAPFVISSFSPIGAMAMELLFLIVYCFFLAILSMTINAVFKQSVGSIICIFVEMVVALFGRRTYQEYSLYPFYNGSFRLLTENNNLEFVNYSIIYWLVLLSAIIILYHIVMRKVDLISLSRENQV